MSGLAGLWNLDGRPASRSVLSAMAAAIAHRGHDHSGLWCSGALGLACQLSRVAPESVDECQPAADGGNVLVFDGRLDNRNELLAALGGGGPAAAAPDSTLVLSAWRQWGDGCLARLNGEFALALFDARLNRLVLARDPVGCRPLYFWTDGKRLVFGSEIKAILAHPDVRAKPDEDLLADYLLLERLPYEDDGETFFAGIRAIRPGRWLSVTPSQTTSGRFWDFDPMARAGHDSFDGHAERLRTLLIAAVSRRLRSRHPIVVATSGGLDSSIVLCIADDLRRSGAADVTLLPISYTALDDPASEENQFIRLLESERGFPVRRVEAGEPDDAAQLSRIIRHSEMPAFDDGACAQEPMLACGHTYGARTLLTGLWSDQFLFTTGYLTDLSMRLAWRQVARHLGEYSRWFPDADPAYFRRRFYRELMLNMTPATLRRGLRPLRTAGARFHARGAINGALKSRVSRRRRIVPARYASAHARTIYQTVRARSHRLQIEADEKIVAGRGLQHVTPFLDRDVIGYLMSVPGEVLNRDGIPRALLREAMRGIVPDRILQRTWHDEGSTPRAGDRNRRRAGLAARTPLGTPPALGHFRGVLRGGANSVELVGLQFWSGVFFSDTLPQPEEGGP